MGLFDSIKSSLGISGIKKNSRGHVLGGSEGSEGSNQGAQRNSNNPEGRSVSLSLFLSLLSTPSPPYSPSPSHYCHLI